MIKHIIISCSLLIFYSCNSNSNNEIVEHESNTIQSRNKKKNDNHIEVIEIISGTISQVVGLNGDIHANVLILSEKSKEDFNNIVHEYYITTDLLVSMLEDSTHSFENYKEKLIEYCDSTNILEGFDVGLYNNKTEVSLAIQLHITNKILAALNNGG